MRRRYGKRRRARGPYAPIKVKRRVGETPGTDMCRATTQIQESSAPKDTRTVYDLDITNISPGSAIDNRDRGLINLRGWKMRVNWVNISDDELVLNYAIISPKTANAVSSAGFLRTYNQSRDADINTILPGIVMAYNPISTDKWNVILHRRHWLLPGASGGDVNSQRGSNYFFLNKYISLKRQVRFNDDTTDNAESGRCFFIWWTTDVGAATLEAPKTNKVILSSDIVTFWKNPKFS